MYSLRAIPVVSLNQHNLFGNEWTLFNRAETDHVSKPGISLLVSMCDTHTASNGDIEPCQFAFSVYNCDETKVIGKDVDIICGWYYDSDFELVNGRQ